MGAGVVNPTKFCFGFTQAKNENKIFFKSDKAMDSLDPQGCLCVAGTLIRKFSFLRRQYLRIGVSNLILALLALMCHCLITMT